MKKFIFILTILIGSGLLILLSFSREGKIEKTTPVTIDFSEGEKLYNWDVKKKSFEEIPLTTSKRGTNTLYLHRLSPIDSIYYRSGDQKPFTLEKKGNTKIVTFGSGLFVCNMQTGLEKYEFRLSDLTLVPKGRGIFLLDTTKEEAKIFSFDSFLDIELVSGTKRSHIANFTLFPSLLFRHDPKNTLELKEADILRISIIDSIRYVDMKTTDDRKILFSGDANADDALLVEIQKDITAKINAFTELYAIALEQDTKKMQNTSFFDTSNTLLINSSKKEVFLKNTLVKNILGLLRDSKKTSTATITATLSEMAELSPKVHSDGLAILRQYYYITTFSHTISKEGLFDFSSQEPPLLSLAEKIIAENVQPKQGEYYIHLGDLFSVYYFLSLSQGELNNSFENILQKILDSKVLSKDEFLPFAFFVTQYLSNGPIILNEDTILTISHLFQITNDYYDNNKSDEKKLTTITSTTFYNYTRIFSKMYSVFLATFIDKTAEGFLLKKDYLDGENTNFEQSFIEAFVKIIDRAKKDIEKKKDALYSKGSIQSDSRVIDSYTLLKTTLKSFDVFTSMLSNYPKYLNDFHLNDANKAAKGILIEKQNDMSMEILQTYLADFNNLDVSSINVTNNFRKDEFYEVQVIVLGNTFNFKLWEQNHMLADISYTDTSGTKHTFPNITIPLDQKKEQLKELASSSEDPVLKYKYDFKNFFETTFLKGDSAIAIESTTPTEDTSSSASPEILLFIQKELLDKDFKNIISFLPIEFRHIHASINAEGDRVVELNAIDKSFVGAGNSYGTELSGKYIFSRHSFSRLVFKVKEEGDTGRYEFGGTSVEILPARISLLSLPDSLKDLGYYIDTIKTAYANQTSIVIDLTGKKVLLDNVPFIPKFPTL